MPGGRDGQQAALACRDVPGDEVEADQLGARVPERGWLLAAVGLLGKVLGPIGLAKLVGTGEWPPAAAILCLTNDFIWWVPFLLYLYDAWPVFVANTFRKD